MKDTIQLYATGETITFTKMTKETKGDFVEMLVCLPTNRYGAPRLRYLQQTVLFEAVEGNLVLDFSDKKTIIEPGKSIAIPPNTSHRYYSIDGKPITFKATYTPARHIEYTIREMVASCNRKNAKDPSPFDACYILQQTKGEYQLENVPLIVQKTVFPATAYVGKICGLIKAKPKSQLLTNDFFVRKQANPVR